MTKKLISLVVLVVLLALAGTALAQGKKKGKAPAKSKTYDFSGDTIDGELVKPDGEFVDARKFADHKSLIKYRQNFLREILKSAEDL